MSRPLAKPGRLGLLLLAAAAACGTDEPPVSSGPNMSGPMLRRMANCPAAVRGAITETARTPDGIDVTITAPDRTAARTVIVLAELHARFPALYGWIPHTGLRSGGARGGFCPILHDATTRLSIAHLQDGVRVHMQARTLGHVRELQELIEARAAWLRSRPRG